MADITIFEVHLGDGTLELGKLGTLGKLGKGPTEGPEEHDETEVSIEHEAEEEGEAEESGSGAKSAVGSLVVLLVLVGIAYAAKKYMGSDDDAGFTELEELDDLAEEA